ncbi:MAG TPA: hypothetical protein VJN42_04005 [Candidatus Acidoferrum sp.]|nr:hypothetical protein [Candidatus Acidoferrum sp.]
MPRKATPKDAELILQLYDLRREPEMRKARHWWLTQFWPNTADDFMNIASTLGTQENNWLRQGGGYWGMAAELVLSGALNADLFLRPAMSGEMFFFFAKIHPFLKELREKLGDPEAFRAIEKVINSSKWGRDRLQFILKRVATARERAAAAKA